MNLWHDKITNPTDLLGPLDLAAGQLGIELIEISQDAVKGRMPVDQRTVQPHGILHGGASCLFAETLGSIAANLTLDLKESIAVGQSLNASHVRPVTGGYVYATARPRHRGRKSQVWEIDIVNEAQDLVCLVTLTMAVIPARAAP